MASLMIPREFIQNNKTTTGGRGYTNNNDDDEGVGGHWIDTGYDDEGEYSAIG
tara:strand:+ start:344 stop:502 length:159 start_codon:yes stop_codon:yes gene_type:complete